mmetsp:Transcript_1256/g.2250  ORF Transcript_1256/g.2250 Transcript_1256/m.2250 type:complete len:173 (-) Transcript_1256:108-626(-)
MSASGGDKTDSQDATAKPPSFPPFPMGSSSLLLQRIQTFLPQIQAANQGLEKNVDGETNPSAYQIDANFALDDDDSDNDNDGVDKEDDDDKDGKAPIIQLRVALGEFDDDENILGTQTTAKGTDGKDDDESEVNNVDLATKQKPASSLLLFKTEESDKKTPKQGKILIEELT